jgi:outer membrane protein
MLKNYILIISTLFAFLNADEPKYSAKVYYGYADEKDFGQILTFQGKRSPLNVSTAGFDLGYMFLHNTWELPIDFYIKGGYARWFENGYQENINELNALIKLYYNIDFSQNRIRLGFGEGGSYTWGIGSIEKAEALEGDATDPKTSKYLNYLDVSVDFDIGRLFKSESLKDTYLGYSLKHRSGIFGLINGVRRGGSNYNTFYIERKF